METDIFNEKLFHCGSARLEDTRTNDVDIINRAINRLASLISLKLKACNGESNVCEEMKAN